MTEAQLAAPFQVFVLVCDRDKNIPPRSAVAFQRILSRRTNGVSASFSLMLDHCRDNYPALWRDYAGGKLDVGLDGFLALLNDLDLALPEHERAILQSELRRLSALLYRKSFLLRPRPAVERAYEQLEHVMTERALPPDAEIRPRERPREKPAAQARPAAPAPRPSPPAAAPPVAAPPAAESPAEEPEDEAVAPTGDSGEARLPSMPPPGEPWIKGPVRLVCAKIVDEARYVKTFSFAGVTRTWFQYQPGQFLTIEPVIDGKKVPRSYTICSTPSRPALLEITVKRVKGGVVSNWLHDSMQVGHELDARGPAGKFSCLRDPRDKYLFLAAGSGITPLMSMLRYLADLVAPVDIVFLQSAATEEDIIFGKELTLIAERNPRICVAITLTDAPPTSAWDGLTGRLDNEMLQRVAPDLAERMVFACGPPPFMEKAKQLLEGNGIPLAAQFREESFTPRAAKPREVQGAMSGASPSRIRFVKSGKDVELAAGATILEAAEKCGLYLPSSCRQGRCGTCKVTLISGEVAMPDQEALSPEEAAQGAVLACIGMPKSGSVEVDL